MRILAVILSLFVFFSCSKKEIGPQCIDCKENNIINTSSSSVLIINEGLYGFGNGSIAIYNDSSNQISQNVFQQNNGIPLGDVVQSAYQFNNKAYIVVNNSNKIEVADIKNFKSLATITGFTSPRYFLPINNNKAYVTDLYSNSIQIVNLNSNTISGSITVNGWTEQLLLHNDTVYVCDMTNNNLLLFNAQTDVFIDSIKVGRQPNSIIKDENDKLWLLCDGGINETNPELIKFNPQTRQIEASFIFQSISESPSELKINGEKNKLYFINSNVYTMGINSSTLPSTSFITSNNNNYYGLGVNPNKEEIYISDAIDFVQNGVIFRYSSSGSLIHQFNSGSIPGDFLFIQQ